MVRWYDCLAAVLMADIMLSVFINTMMSESILSSVLGGIILMVLYDAWKFYSVWRLVIEKRRR